MNRSEKKAPDLKQEVRERYEKAQQAPRKSVKLRYAGKEPRRFKSFGGLKPGDIIEVDELLAKSLVNTVDFEIAGAGDPPDVPDHQFAAKEGD